MKKHTILQICILSISIFYGCGDGGDAETAPTSTITNPPILTNTSIPTDSTDDTWVPLSEDYITELLETDVPPLISWVDDPELQRKYNHALLLKEHGDIPQIRTIIEFELNHKPGGTVDTTPEFLEREIAYLESVMFLWPSKETQETLAFVKNLKLHLTLDMKSLTEENPRLYIQITRSMLIDEFGDLPEVHTYTTILLNILLEEPITEAELEAYQKAMDTLWPEIKEE